LSLVLLAGVLVTCFAALGASLTVRVFASVAFVLVMINVVLNVIGDLQRTLVEQANTDPLTGAYNRRHLQTHLSKLLGPVDPGRPTEALLAIDIDHFKEVNDRHGHEVGDDVLRKLVAAVSGRKRNGDLLFRTGGEEFMLLVSRITPSAALDMAEDLRLRVAHAQLLPNETVSVSIGVSALCPGQTVQAWMKSADQALYEAKRLGRNRVVIASSVQAVAALA
jgi:diguanylate cyclase (GGDEF)-like protein